MSYKYEKPVEMPRGSHYGSNYWIFYSLKLNRIVKAFSNLERENLLTLEMNHKVEYYCEQPLAAEVCIDSKMHKTVFDVWVHYKDGREEFQEVKYSTDVGKSSKQIETQKAWCQQNGCEHVMRTEKDISCGNMFIRNLDMLYGHVRRLRKPVNTIPILDYIRSRRPQTVGQLSISGLFSKGRTMDSLAKLYYDGLIIFSNIESEVISNTTEVHYNGK